MDILEIVWQGSETAEKLEQPSSLQEAAESLLAVLTRLDEFGVVAASPCAERVIGAAMMLDPSLRANGSGRTVIFDVSIASGTLISRAARRLREAGNSEPLVGVALHSLVDHRVEWSSSELDDVFVVGTQTKKNSTMWERAQRSDRGVLLAR